MKLTLTITFAILGLVSYSQQDSIVLNTTLSVDSILRNDQTITFTQSNDSIITFKMERNIGEIDDHLFLFSDSKKYVITLPKDPVYTFHGEWNNRDPKNSMNITIEVEKSKMVNMRAGGSSVNTMSSLVVYDSSGNLVEKECSGIRLVENRKHRNRRGEN